MRPEFGPVNGQSARRNLSRDKATGVRVHDQAGRAQQVPAAGGMAGKQADGQKSPQAD